MDLLQNILIPLVIALLASSGFWALLEKRSTKSTGQTELLIGLAHDRIIWLGMSYIQRGWLYHDEYENLINYLYRPYQKLGGNGSVLRVMEEVNKLPIKQQQLFNDQKEK